MGPNVTFSMVFYLVITDFQYNSQNAEVPLGPKQPGPTVFIDYGFIKLFIESSFAVKHQMNDINEHLIRKTNLTV